MMTENTSRRQNTQLSVSDGRVGMTEDGTRYTGRLRHTPLTASSFLLWGFRARPQVHPKMRSRSSCRMTKQPGRRGTVVGSKVELKQGLQSKGPHDTPEVKEPTPKADPRPQSTAPVQSLKNVGTLPAAFLNGFVKYPLDPLRELTLDQTLALAVCTATRFCSQAARKAKTSPRGRRCGLVAFMPKRFPLSHAISMRTVFEAVVGPHRASPKTAGPLPWTPGRAQPLQTPGLC
ncbi:hypothetical protein Celaphus_00011276 [Cervus elaphus hippelaphus]|uniref:Uncharacterized protein n=1 Tax=Cervus elaphus hippelaphus TaxID=46360 RepID=A0A212CQX7_CEREH|nr:hypothetical protein Celaphus_00011276 [Cervus elaphus hippelaphus]